MSDANVRKQCERCDKLSAIITCASCDELYCKICFEQTHPADIVKHHDIIPIGSLSNVYRRQTCIRHQNKKYISRCVTCEKDLCIFCRPKHKSHEVFEFRELYFRNLENLSRWNFRLSQIFHKTKEISCREDVEERTDDDKAVLEESFSKLHCLLDLMKKEILSANSSISQLQQVSDDVSSLLVGYENIRKSSPKSDSSKTDVKDVEEENREIVSPGNQNGPDVKVAGDEKSNPTIPTPHKPRLLTRSREHEERKKSTELSKEDLENLVQIKNFMSPNEMFLQTSSSADMKDMYARCLEQANRCPSFGLREWIGLRPGGKLLAKLTSDRRWYRCEVVASKESLPPVDDSKIRKVRVRCVDGGSYEWACFSVSRMMPPALRDLPSLCRRCSLNLLPFSSSEWSEEDVSTIADVLGNRCFLLQRLSEDTVDLWPLPRRPTGFSVRQWIVMSRLGRLAESPEWRLDLSALTDDQKTSLSDLGGSGGSVGPGLLYPDVAGEAAVAANRAAVHIDLPDQSIVRFSCLDALPAVWVTPHPLCDSMAFKKTHAAVEEDPEGLFCPRTGGLYVAEFHDGLWYRCVVENVDDHFATVMSVDFGNYWTVEWETGVRRLRDRWRETPYLAKRVKLADLRFAENVEMNPLSDILQASSVYLLRYAHVVDSSRKVNDFVYLLHRSACINLSLVERGLATVAVEQSRLMRNLVAEGSAHVRRHFKDDPPTGSLRDAPLPPPPLGFINISSARAPGFCHCRGNFKVDMAIGDATPLTFDALLTVDRRLGLLTDGEAGRLASLPHCSVTHVASPDEIYVRLETPERDRQRERLSSMLQTLHSTHQHPATRLQSVELAITGELCAVVRPIHLEWCRGLVLGACPENKANLRVLFIDTGEKLSVPCSYVVQPLDPSFLSNFPLSSIRCRVLGVRPAASDAGKWPAVARDTIVEILRPRGSQCRLSRVAASSTGVDVDLLVPDVNLGWSLHQGEEADVEKEVETMRSLSEKLQDCGVVMLSSDGDPLDNGDPDLPVVPVCAATLRQQLGLKLEGRRNMRVFGLGRGRVEWPRQKLEKMVGRRQTVMVDRVEESGVLTCYPPSE